MAEEHANKVAGSDEQGAVESKDRGMFDFLGKKKEKAEPQHEAVATEFDKVKIEETKAEKEHKEGEKKPSLLEKLHRSDNSSSSSSDEEEGEGGEKKKKKEKKGLTEKIKEKIGGEKKEGDTAVPVEKCDSETTEKGVMEKIKEKIPMQHKKDEEVKAPPLAATVSAEKVTVVHHEEELQEKKGFLEKIKEKIPGYHTKTEDDKVKEKETTASH
ncbi:Phosphoprotein ECPP44 [Hibiscus syriacus]|uniref:Phosphoprotein ECPP44 n=1 Tax=Hibiscus syriacus TaxID=106335 RepID=A0A6A3AI21_HIBSY|nr:phosphoprotein ECPP44-like [Hibiscus syriacus]KAE8704221.1 Phosphoprotein ECPP44 [Hibiscus syriacus]